MSKHSRTILALLISVFIQLSVGCTVPFQGGPREVELEEANYGNTPRDYEKQIRDHLNNTLFDPFTAHVDIGQPKKAWWGYPGGLAVSRDIRYGWRVEVRVNAKNRFGGYTGWQTHRFYFERGVLVERFGSLESP